MLKYRLTIVNVTGFLYVIVVLGYTIFNWEILSKGESWGLVPMIFLFFLGIAALIIDFILQLFIKDIWKLISLEIIIFLLVKSYFR